MNDGFVSSDALLADVRERFGSLFELELVGDEPTARTPAVSTTPARPPYLVLGPIV